MFFVEVLEEHHRKRYPKLARSSCHVVLISNLDKYKYFDFQIILQYTRSRGYARRPLRRDYPADTISVPYLHECTPFAYCVKYVQCYSSNGSCKNVIERYPRSKSVA